MLQLKCFSNCVAVSKTPSCVFFVLLGSETDNPPTPTTLFVSRALICYSSHNYFCHFLDAQQQLSLRRNFFLWYSALRLQTHKTDNSWRRCRGRVIQPAAGGHDNMFFVSPLDCGHSEKSMKTFLSFRRVCLKHTEVLRVQVSLWKIF